MGQVYESQWKWGLGDEDVDEEADDEAGYFPSMHEFQVNTAFQLGELHNSNKYAQCMSLL